MSPYATWAYSRISPRAGPRAERAYRSFSAGRRACAVPELAHSLNWCFLRSSGCSAVLAESPTVPLTLTSPRDCPLVGVGMLMPGELTLDLHDANVVVVDLGNLLRRPALSKSVPASRPDLPVPCPDRGMPAVFGMGHSARIGRAVMPRSGSRAVAFRPGDRGSGCQRLRGDACRNCVKRPRGDAPHLPPIRWPTLLGSGRR